MKLVLGILAIGVLGFGFAPSAAAQEEKGSAKKDPAAAVQSAEAPLALKAPAPTGKEVYTATASVQPEKGPMKSVPVTIVIDRWTTEPEKEKIAGALKSGGSDAARKLLDTMKDTGYIEIKEKRWPTRYAYARDLGGGTRLVTIASMQPMFFLGESGMVEKGKEGYDCALMDLTLDGAGKGDGTLAAAAKLKLNPEGALEVKDYSRNLIRLDSVAKKAQ